MSGANRTLGWDVLKLERDGHLGYGSASWAMNRRIGLRPLYKFIERLPSGNYLTTDGHMGALEWEPMER